MKETFRTPRHPRDVFAAKFQPDGSSLAYSTLLGGTDSAGIALDQLGNVYLTGATRWADFLTTNPLHRDFNGADATASKITDEMAGAFSLPTRRLKFGNTGVGRTRARTFVIRARGGLLFGHVEPVRPPFSITQGLGPFSLGPGQQWRVTVEFTPDSSGRFRDMLLIDSSDLQRRLNQVELLGSASKRGDRNGRHDLGR